MPGVWVLHFQGVVASTAPSPCQDHRQLAVDLAVDLAVRKLVEDVWLRPESPSTAGIEGEGGEWVFPQGIEPPHPDPSPLSTAGARLPPLLPKTFETRSFSRPPDPGGGHSDSSFSGKECTPGNEVECSPVRLCTNDVAGLSDERVGAGNSLLPVSRSRGHEM